MPWMIARGIDIEGGSISQRTGSANWRQLHFSVFVTAATWRVTLSCQVARRHGLAPARPGHGIGFDWKGLAQLAP